MAKPIRSWIAIVFGIAIGEGHAVNDGYRFLEFPNALPGKVLKIKKEFDKETGRVKLVSNDASVSTPEDMVRLEKMEEETRRRLEGNLDKALTGKLETMGDYEKEAVIVRMKLRTGVYLDKTRNTREALRENSLNMLELGPVEPIEVCLARYGLKAEEIQGKSKATCFATQAQLMRLKEDPNIASVVMDKQEEPSSGEPEFVNLANSAYNPGPVPAGSGAGVNSATFERGITQGFLNCAGISPVLWDPFEIISDVEKRHSNSVFYNLALAAPGANLYHKASLYYDDFGVEDYIINNGIQTVSISRERGGMNPSRSTYSEFLLMDDFAYRFPYPVFSTGTANNGYQYEVNWQGYNAISVGNVRHTNNTTFELADCTQTKNPPPVYGSCIAGSGADCAGDREMPYVVAPGIPHTGSLFATTCLEGAGSVTCGTSYSAPLVNGLAADVIASDPRMGGWPEKVRATLILTAQNVDGGYWAASIDGRDGAGTVSGSEAVSFAKTHTTVSPNNSAVQKGMGAFAFYATDFGSNKRFNVRVPNPKPAGKHLRVVLTWDSNPDINAGVNGLSDLDLVCQKNGGTILSSSWDNNVEMVDVPSANLTAGNAYYVDVAPYTNRIPAGARTTFFYYAIAWAWVKDHAP